jgi:hypothetical protein
MFSESSMHEFQVEVDVHAPPHDEIPPPLPSDQTPPAVQTEIRQLKTMISQVSAASKVHHDEMMKKMEALEQKITHMSRKLSARR